MGCFLRLNVGLYTAGNPTLFIGNLPWDFTGRINWAETPYLLYRFLITEAEPFFDD